MRTVATILVIFFARCMYLCAEPQPGLKEDVGDFLHSNSCIFGVKSVSMTLYNSRYPEGKNIGVDECDYLEPSQPVFFIVHGFISSSNTSRTRELASRLVQKNNTVFALDWSQGACTDGIPIIKLMEYPSAVDNTRDVGQFMASYVESLIKKCHIPLESIKFIGHSLGAHVSGFAAKNIQKSGNISLIIAADPANPIFDPLYTSCEKRLCKSDAERLVVLHTSSLGISKSIGHLDLQFQNGMIQPGCGLNVSCSHGRSIDYIIDVLGDNNCGFPGVPMETKRSIFESTPSLPDPETKDCIVVNSKILDSDNPMKGRYYVFVKSANPHCTQETYSCQQQ